MTYYTASDTPPNGEENKTQPTIPESGKMCSFFLQEDNSRHTWASEIFIVSQKSSANIIYFRLLLLFSQHSLQHWTRQSWSELNSHTGGGNNVWRHIMHGFPLPPTIVPFVSLKEHFILISKWENEKFVCFPFGFFSFLLNQCKKKQKFQLINLL